MKHVQRGRMLDGSRSGVEQDHRRIIHVGRLDDDEVGGHDLGNIERRLHHHGRWAARKC
jgi:hypothetical protein